MTTAELEVAMESAELGAEYLIRVRVVEVSEETLDVTRMGHEPQVLAGRRSAKLLPLAVQPYMGEQNTGTEPRE